MKPQAQKKRTWSTSLLKLYTGSIFVVILMIYFRRKYLLSKGDYLFSATTGSPEWAPLIIEKCVSGMSKKSAPCISVAAKDSNLIYAQELIYRPFKIAVPGFVVEADRNHWMKHAPLIDRFSLSKDKSWAIYPTQYGQVLVFKDATYNGNPVPDAWGDGSCVGKSVQHSQFFNRQLKSNTKHQFVNEDFVIVATSPDSWSMQHFQDRVLPLVVQASLAQSYFPNVEPVLLTGAEPKSTTLSLYRKFGIQKHLHYYLHHSRPINAKYLLFPCRMPLVHPWLQIEVSKKLGWLENTIPLNKRLDVVWFGREYTDQHQLNKGRRLVNEDILLAAINDLLIKRNLGERLVIFNLSIHGNIGESPKYMTENVRAVIGLHGAKFYNARYCPKGTFVLEIFQKLDDNYPPCFWEQSRLAYQNYFIHFAEAINKAEGFFSDMIIHDIPALIDVLDKNLAINYPESEALQEYSFWEF